MGILKEFFMLLIGGFIGSSIMVLYNMIKNVDSVVVDPEYTFEFPVALGDYVWRVEEKNGSYQVFKYVVENVSVKGFKADGKWHEWNYNDMFFSKNAANAFLDHIRRKK